MKFLRNFLASLSALIVFGFLLVAALMVSLASLMVEEPVKVKESSILKLGFNKPITEQEVVDPFEELGSLGNGGSMGLTTLVQVIDAAQNDDKIDGIVIKPGLFLGNYASADEIRRALKRFKESGKFIVAYSDNYSELGYFLATVADEIHLAPEGMVEFNGLTASPIFFKGLLDKLEIQPEIFRVGEFKSAVEPFIRTDMSDENRLQLEALLSSVNEYFMSEIAEGRGLSIDEIQEMSQTMRVRNASDAMETKIIDGITYADEFEALMKKKMGTEEDLNWVSYSNYKNTVTYNKAEDKVALIVAEGEIVGGDSPDFLSADRISKYIKKAREDDKVKAVVFRVNSPGGQLQASEKIWRELSITREVKPVIASFSDYAASGGYYISMGADEIVTNPVTVTGSIGIFGVFFNIGNMMENKLGLTVDEVNTGEYSGILNPTREMTDSERAIFQTQIESGYETFIQRVTDNRTFGKDSIMSLASGRVWSGTQALNNGLANRLGGLVDALDLAAEKAELEEYQIIEYPPKRNILNELFDLGANQEEKVASRYLGDSWFAIKNIRNLMKYQGAQARMPYYLKFE